MQSKLVLLFHFLSTMPHQLNNGDRLSGLFPLKIFFQRKTDLIFGISQRPTNKSEINVSFASDSINAKKPDE